MDVKKSHRLEAKTNSKRPMHITFLAFLGLRVRCDFYCITGAVDILCTRHKIINI